MTRVYNRSEVLSYWELTDTQQVNVISNYFNNNEQAEEDRYVIIEDDHSPLPLSMFMKTGYPFDNRKHLWDGIYSTSAWSAYFIKLSRCGTMAVVADRYF